MISPTKLVLSLALSCATVFSFAQETESGWLPDGFVKTTFASPPNITYPTGLAVSPNGVAYVSVDLNSSLDREAHRGKIVRCEDTDGDGIADKFNDFVADIDSPRGSSFAGDTLYVIHPPFLSAFRDTDGDGVGEQDILINGIGFDLSFRGADHTTNSVRMGIDGWLYIAVGDYGFYNAVAKDGSSYHLHGGGIMRIRPDGTELEPYSLNTRNVWDIAVSPTLDVFARDNTNDGKGWDTRLHHSISLADHGYPRLYKNFPDEILAPLADYGGGSGTGAYYLDEPGFPDKYNDKLYTLDFTTKQVYLHDLNPVEATFRIEQESFYAIQAIDMDVDGFSRIFVSDWEGGRYRYQDPDVGSVTMITYPGLKSASFPDLKKASDSDLLKYIVSDSAVSRLNTQREILKRGQNRVFKKGLTQLSGDQSQSLHGRIAAIFTLKQLYGIQSHPALVALAKDKTVREYALRALADRKSQTTKVPTEPFVRGLADENPRVQLQSIIGIARLGRTDLADKILPLAISKTAQTDGPNKYDNNRVIPHIARKAIVQLNAVEYCLAALDDEALQQAALNCLQEMHTEKSVDGLISKLQSSKDDELKAKILPALFRLYHKEKKWDGKNWWTTRPDDRGPYFEPITWEASAKIKKAIENSFTENIATKHPNLMLAMRKNRIDPAGLSLTIEIDEVLAMIEAKSPGDVAIEPLKLAALSESRPDATRAAAFHALRRIIGPEAFEAQLYVLENWLLTDPDTKTFKDAATEYVFSSEHATRLRGLGGAARDTVGYPRQLAFMICLNLADSPLTNDFTKSEALAVIEEGKATPEFVRAVGQLRLSKYREIVAASVNSDQHELSLAASEALVQLGAASANQSANLNKKVSDLEYSETLKMTMAAAGDIELGQQLFARQSCIACHTTSQDQPQKGPYLGDAGSKWKKSDLIQSILQPNAVVAQGFQTQWFKLNDGRSLEGFVSEEKDGQIEVRNIAGMAIQFSETEIAERGMRENSMMPEGLANNLSIHELSSLVGFLQSLK